MLPGNHALYLATCQIQIEEDQSWHATIRIFRDDLEDALVEKSGVRLDLTGVHLSEHKEYLDEYMQTHFSLSSKGMPVSYQIQHYEQVNDVVEIILRGDDIWPQDTYSITCNILMELFDSQKNAMTITHREMRKTLLFTKRQPSHDNLSN